METFDARLLTPPREEEEVYPYRRVWRSIALESGILFVIAIFLFLLWSVFGVQISKTLQRLIGILLALTPAGLWFIFSLWRERFVLEPRQRLLPVLIVSALAANAIGVAVVNDFLQVNQWLPLASAVDRILGYMFTVGVVQEFLKYFVVRYTVWPVFFRVRLDGVAYGAASAIGYVTVLNFHFVFQGTPSPDTVAIHVFSNTALHIVTSVIVGYGMGEVYFSRPSPLFLPMTITFAMLVTGIVIPVRSGLINANLGLQFSTAKPLWSLLFSATFLVSMLLIMVFLFNNATRREREAIIDEV